MYRFKQLIGKWLLLSTLLCLSSWANATTCSSVPKFEVVNKGTSSSAVTAGTTLTIKTSNANDLGVLSIKMVVSSDVIAPNGGDSCFFGFHIGGQSVVIGNFKITMSSPTFSGCTGVDIGNQNGNATYKGGANFASPFGALNTGLQEVWGCQGSKSFLTQEMQISVVDKSKPVQGASIPASSFVKISAGQSSTNLNGQVILTSFSFQVLSQSPTCSLSIPSTVRLKDLSGIRETAQGLMKTSQIEIPVSLVNCNNFSGVTQTPNVTLTDANNTLSSCSMVNIANARSRGVVSLFLDSELTKKVCFRTSNNKLIYSSLTNGQQGVSETKNISAVIEVPALTIPLRTVFGQIQSSVVLLLDFP
jgi:hypothetical protein